MDHFRYAYDLAKIDFLGTSDHTDIGKIYHPYEWWHNQRMHDALHSPGHFNTVYVYEPNRGGLGDTATPSSPSGAVRSCTSNGHST